jgi:predicted metal-dependent peptidase
MRQVSKLDKAKAQIVLDHPFFASILLKKELTPDQSIPTLCVNPKGHIRYNPEFIENLTVPQISWALCHEIGHVIAQHALRRGDRDPKKWNYAGDAWINDMLNDAGIGESIPHTVNIPGSKDKTTETIYDELPDSDDGSGSGGDGDPGQSGSDNSFDNGLGDDIEDEDLTESERKEIEAEVKLDIAQAAQIAKMRGKLPGKLAKIVEDIINVKTPWYDILERYMASMTKQDYTWLKPNRRYVGSGVYLPSVGTLPQMGEVVIQKDISGSVNIEEDAYFNGHIKRIIETCRPTKVHVLYTDSKVQRHDVFEFGEEVKFESMRGGGTDMRAGFNYVEQEGLEPDVVITLTDGETPYPTHSDVANVWCISRSTTAPIGDTVQFEIERT